MASDRDGCDQVRVTKKETKRNNKGNEGKTGVRELMTTLHVVEWCLWYLFRILEPVEKKAEAAYSLSATMPANEHWVPRTMAGLENYII